MDLSSLTYAKNSRKTRKRIGRGQGSGHGGTACRGHKGQLSRAGASKRPWFEGGQMPLQRRLPKRGFTNIFRTEYQIVNLRDIERIKDIDAFDPKIMYNKRLTRKKNIPVKVLGEGTVERKLSITANAFSKSAVEKIEKAGWRITVL
jgi:large subunit ribosomal protein L15